MKAGFRILRASAPQGTSAWRLSLCRSHPCLRSVRAQRTACAKGRVNSAIGIITVNVNTRRTNLRLGNCASGVMSRKSLIGAQAPGSKEQSDRIDHSERGEPLRPSCQSYFCVVNFVPTFVSGVQALRNSVADLRRERHRCVVTEKSSEIGIRM